MALRYNTDGLGMTYVGIVVAWTCLLLPASVLLIRNRHLPYLRMRNIPLSISAVATLHVYWVLCMIAYLLNGYFPCAAEYWIMSIYLPLGIALFQATNCQLLSIAAAQGKYARGDVIVDPTTPSSHRIPAWRKWWARLKAANATRNTMTWIGIGMLAQVSHLPSSSNITHLSRWSFHWSYFWCPRNSTLRSVPRAQSFVSIITFPVPMRPQGWLADGDGNGRNTTLDFSPVPDMFVGGHRSSGSFSGPGSTPPSFSGGFAAFAMFMDGELKLWCASFLGETLPLHVTITL